MTTGIVAAAAPKIVHIEGTDYFVSPLTIQDWETVISWVKDAFMSQAMAALASVPEQLKPLAMDSIFRIHASLAVSSPEAKAILSTRVGGSLVQWLAMRGRHPDLKREQVDKWMSDKATRELLNGAFVDAQGYVTDSKEKSAEGNAGAGGKP